ncbi:MAG: hypothetical protein R3A10_13900 [Caldilineaceae bacterium]
MAARPGDAGPSALTGCRWSRLFVRGTFHPPRPQKLGPLEPAQDQGGGAQAAPLPGAAIKALRPGGVLLYCTCSFAPEENEVVVNLRCATSLTRWRSLLTLPVPNAMPGLTGVAGKALNPQLSRSVRLLPTAEMTLNSSCASW